MHVFTLCDLSELKSRCVTFDGSCARIVQFKQGLFASDSFLAIRSDLLKNVQ